MKIAPVINSACVLAMLIVLSGCGSEDDSTAGGNSERTQNVNASAAMEPCESLNESLVDLPLNSFVAGLELLAEKGESCAQYGLGSLYIWGFDGIAADHPKAEAYLTAAAGQGHELANVLLKYHF